MSSDNKHWAKEYILDPLNAPEPAEETGPGSHFVRPKESTSRSGIVTPPAADNNPFSDSHDTAKVAGVYPSPPQSSSPQRMSHRQEAFKKEHRHRRSSSLNEKFPGDMSHRPLDQLAKEKHQADRSRHITKKHHIRPDQVDLLDEAAAGGAYHHGGPYDATLFARNNSYNSSPVAAVSNTNAETIKATPRERLIDSIDRHRPLDGVAQYESGESDMNGHVYNYEKGENMMVDLDPPGGAYKQWPGLQYHPDDIKGKAEPSYTIEKQLKEHKISEGKRLSGEPEGMEMTSHSRNSSASAIKAEAFSDETKLGRSGSLSKRLGDGIKKRIGSIKRQSRHED